MHHIIKEEKPEDSNLNKYEINNLIKFFDLIRSTDAPGYPSAYLNFKNFYIEIFNAKMSKQTINARIKISKKNNIQLLQLILMMKF